MQLSKVNTFQVPVLNEELQTMSSKEIAELTGKQHSHVVRDIRNMLDDLQKDDPEMDYPKEDKDNRGYTSCFHLNKELSITLVAGYNTSMRLAIVRRWQELEAKEKQNVLMLPNFTDPAEAAEGTIRKYYAESKGRNACHGSDSDENAEIEGKFHFSANELV